MNIKNVDESIIKKMIDINLNSINKIINATVEDFLNIENFKNKMATKVYENIQNAIKDVKLSQLMTATNLFGSGLGSKKLQLIINKIPDILNLKINKSNLADEIKKIDGFDTKTATQFAEKLPAFKKFLKENKNITILVEENKKLNNNLQDKKFVFTGFRNKMLEEIIVKSGGEITNTISKNTTYLVTNNKEAKSSKLAKATDLNIKILNVDELLKILKIKHEVLEI